jgi:hypothetical protein
MHFSFYFPGKSFLLLPDGIHYQWVWLPQASFFIPFSLDLQHRDLRPLPFFLPVNITSSFYTWFSRAPVFAACRRGGRLGFVVALGFCSLTLGPTALAESSAPPPVAVSPHHCSHDYIAELPAAALTPHGVPRLSSGISTYSPWTGLVTIFFQL